MASLIDCPHCGPRPREEFTIRGTAMGPRPGPSAEPAGEQWLDYVYLRDNPRGAVREHWHHGSGCGRWLVVTRSAVNHGVTQVSDAQGLRGERT